MQLSASQDECKYRLSPTIIVYRVTSVNFRTAVVREGCVGLVRGAWFIPQYSLHLPSPIIAIPTTCLCQTKTRSTMHRCQYQVLKVSITVADLCPVSIPNAVSVSANISTSPRAAIERSGKGRFTPIFPFSSLPRQWTTRFNQFFGESFPQEKIPLESHIIFVIEQADSVHVKDWTCVCIHCAKVLNKTSWENFCEF